MSTPITQIRSIIQDQALYQSDAFTGDGVDKILHLTYFPVIASSVIITPTGGAITVDEQNGVVKFAVAPAIGQYTVEYYHVLLLDTSIQDMIDVEGDATVDVRLPAADCLDAIASSQALIQKKMKLLDLETDGPALAKALRDHALMLRKQVLDPAFQEAIVDWAEEVYDNPSWLEKITKDWMRSAL